MDVYIESDIENDELMEPARIEGLLSELEQIDDPDNLTCLLWNTLQLYIHAWSTENPALLAEADDLLADIHDFCACHAWRAA